MRVPSFWLATAGSFEDGGLGRGCLKVEFGSAIATTAFGCGGSHMRVEDSRRVGLLCFLAFIVLGNLHVDLLFQLPAVGVVTSLRRWVALPRSLQA